MNDIKARVLVWKVDNLISAAKKEDNGRLDLSGKRGVVDTSCLSPDEVTRERVHLSYDPKSGLPRRYKSTAEACTPECVSTTVYEMTRRGDVCTYTERSNTIMIGGRLRDELRVAKNLKTGTLTVLED